MGTAFNTKKIAASYLIVEKRKKYTNFEFLYRSYYTRTQNFIAQKRTFSLKVMLHETIRNDDF